MAANKKPAEELVINNPQYNRTGELIAFEGIKLVNNKADKSDPKTMELIKKVQALPRKSPYTGSSAPRVKINEKEYALSYKFFTADEVTTYNNYQDAHGGKGSSNRGNSIGDRKTFDMLSQMIDKYSKKKEFAKVVEDLKAQRKLYMTALSREELMDLLLAGNL